MNRALRITIKSTIGIILLFVCVMILSVMFAPKRGDYLARGKVASGFVEAQIQLNFVQELCLEDTLIIGEAYKELEFKKSKIPYVESVQTEITTDHVAKIIITYNTLYDEWGFLKSKRADAGSTLIMKGECREGYMKWLYEGTLPESLMAFFNK